MWCLGIQSSMQNFMDTWTSLEEGAVWCICVTECSLVKFCLSRSRCPLCWHGLALISAWISIHMPSNVWDEITYPFPNFNGCTVEVSEWISNFTPQFIMWVIAYPCWGSSKTFSVKGSPDWIRKWWRFTRDLNRRPFWKMVSDFSKRSEYHY